MVWVSLVFSVVLAALAVPAIAGDTRDIVFDCPCSAEWTPGGPGENGELKLTFGVRSFRTTESGDIRIVQFLPQSGGHYSAVTQSEAAAPSVLPALAMAVSDRQTRTIALNRPHAGEPVGVALWERVGETPDGVRVPQAWHRHENLVLWPVGDVSGDRARFVDILTDTDGDGVGDVNEELAGTSPDDGASIPGESTVDILALYNDGFRTALDGYPFTQIHHVLVLTDALYRDSGTNLRLRMVGVQEVELDGKGLPNRDIVLERMERHGADLTFRLHMGENMGCNPGFAGCAVVGGILSRGHWRGEVVHNSVCRGTSTALCAAHELGHNLGLAHSAQVGESYGLFRWSRGHSPDRETGTIMAPGHKVLDGVFADPTRDCEGAPCGVPVDWPDGANAVRSLDLVRFQVAAHRSSLSDTDGDGIVDPADALPEDPGEWVDLDADGIGDLADADVDGDGVANADDPFPYDGTEWEDRDDDGIGDNSDDEVVDISPFRDSALRAAVERELGKAPGAPITAEDLAVLSGLTATYGDVGDLTGLELAENLKQLFLEENRIADLAPLSGLEQLGTLNLNRNRIGDLSPLRNLSGLLALAVAGNPISDLSPLTELPRLEVLSVGGGDHGITDLSPLAELTTLKELRAKGLGITDLNFLTGMAELWVLDIGDNPVADLSPLSGMTKLRNVDLRNTAVGDLSPLSDRRLGLLDVGGTSVTLEDVARLRHSRQLVALGIPDLGLRDISVLAEFHDLQTLVVSHNSVSDLSPLSGLTNLGLLHIRGNDVSNLGPLRDLPQLHNLDLADNAVSDVGPLAGLSELSYLNLQSNEVADISALVDRSIWNLESGNPVLFLQGNPLDRQAYDQHIPTLRSWGVTVHADEPPAEESRVVVPMTDPVLRALVGQAQARWWFRVDHPITEEFLGGLIRLHGYNAGVSHLTGLHAARDLVHVFLGSNLVSDLAPLADLDELEGLDLANNLISDIGPLVENRNIGRGDWITLSGNPLSEESLNVHVPALRERGVQVAIDSVRLFVSPDSRATAFDVSGYFTDTLDPDSQTTVTSGDTASTGAEVVDGELRVALADSSGPSTVTVTGTGADGASESLDFHVSLRQVIALFPAAASPNYQGFVRVINHSPR
ncbi:MAG: M12 family metallo-peptidase, partial [Rhodospirillaceae bacterium]|nr:M12 family metallo-peptidase [Rhodospirillaceae bacterium]